MHLFSEISNLSTEQRNPNSIVLDELTTDGILCLINSEDALVAEAVRAEIPEIAKVVDQIVRHMKSGGRLFYVGAGTSGRMGVIDAAECPPTFGTDPTTVQAIIAGGKEAVFRSQEGAEDDPQGGANAIDELNVGANDVVVGIAASKRTPFVLGGLERAKTLAATTVLVTTNPRSDVSYAFLDFAICPIVGPEVLMGSTRMKSAIAQKMVLTMLTTATMVKLGKVYENMMVDLQQTNRKLVERSKRIIMIATGCDYDRASELLDLSGKHVKTAIVMQLRKVDRSEALRLLVRNDGFVRRAISGD